MPKKLVLAISFILATVFITPTALAGTTSPTTTLTKNPSSPDGSNNWYVSPVFIKLTATDLESGVKEINYKINDGAWQQVRFDNTLNLAPNPSFENMGATSTGMGSWEASVIDGQGTYSRDPTDYAPSYEVASAKIGATGGAWHGINHRDEFSVATEGANMTASTWIKTENVVVSAYFNVYAIADDGFGGEITQLLGTSPTVSGSVGWVKINLDFTVTLAGTKGVYMDIGLTDLGILWADAITINTSTKSAKTDFTLATDSEEHTIEYYSVDFAGNIENHSCTEPLINCEKLKMDMTPPGNWHDSGAFRSFFGSSHELWVYTNVEDATSGLSVFTDKYQYHVDSEGGFGRYENISGCNTAWLQNQWVILISPPFVPGVKSAFLLTPRTDFCNSNWKICKTVKFFSEDLAGNSATKDFCINGPWIRLTGKGIVRSNHNIDMLAEANADNTDGLIEITGTSIDFFATSIGYTLKNSPVPEIYDYDKYWNLIESKTEISGSLVSSDGIYNINGNFELKNQTVPSNYDNTTFDQVVFVDGDLLISNDIEINDLSTALFIVKGKVEIVKNIDMVGVAIFADGDFYTAFDIREDEASNPMEFKGLYSANKFIFQRTLQGTNNRDIPSEDFTYEPKYLVQLKDLFGKYSVTWKYIE